MTFKTQGIILRYIDSQEYNRVYILLTKERGKTSAVARGVRKIKSKQNGKLKPFSVIELMIANGKKIDTLATADTVKNFPNLQKNLLVLGLATFCTELVDQLIEEGEKDLKVYRLLEEVLTLLNDNYDAAPEKLESLSWLFAFRLIDYLGYGPDLFKCVSCQASLKVPYMLAPQKGGLVCDRHASEQECVEVSAHGMELLRTVRNMKLPEFLEMPMEPHVAKELSSYIKHMVSTHLRRELKSQKFLERI